MLSFEFILLCGKSCKPSKYDRPNLRKKKVAELIARDVSEALEVGRKRPKGGRDKATCSELNLKAEPAAPRTRGEFRVLLSCVCTLRVSTTLE